MHVPVFEDLLEVAAAPVLPADVGDQPLLAEREAPEEEVGGTTDWTVGCHRTTIVPSRR